MDEHLGDAHALDAGLVGEARRFFRELGRHCGANLMHIGNLLLSGRKTIIMADLTSLSLQLDNKTGTCRAIIETPKGCRNKFDYDPETGLFMLGGLLPEGMMFPFDFGFLPSTLGEDGDPLDIMVLMDAPAHVGCLIEVRIIGIITAEQTEDGKTESNDRLLGRRSTFLRPSRI